MKKIKLNNFIDKFLIVFLIIQPIFDTKFFYNSISTLIRVIIIFFIFIYYFFTSKNKHKYWLLLYPCSICVYFIFHHINALNFTSLVPGNFNYSIIKEGLYFVKMMSPFLLIYSLYKVSFTENKIISIMKSLVLTISIVIIVSNLIGFSYGNYSDIVIKANFLEWFNPNTSYTYQDLASKGLFEYGNQIGAILIMFLPFMLYTSLENRKVINWLTISFNVFSLILLCTRVSVFGILIVLFYAVFAFAFISFIKKKHFSFKQYIPICIILIVYSVLLPINPMFSRLAERENVIETFHEVEENKTIEVSETEPLNTTIEEVVSSSVDNKSTYILANYELKKLHRQFLFENYPYEYDTEFWYNFLQNDISLTTDYRYIEISMIKRVLEINNNPKDKWLGITNTRLQNIFNIEKDFIVQYYSLGILGLILVFIPYIILVGLFIYKTISSKFANLTVLNLLSIITILFIFGIAYFSGNLFNSLSFTIYFALCFYFIKT